MPPSRVEAHDDRPHGDRPRDGETHRNEAPRGEIREGTTENDTPRPLTHADLYRLLDQGHASCEEPIHTTVGELRRFIERRDLVENYNRAARCNGRVDASELVRMHDSGMTLKVIGEHFGVTRERVRQVAKQIGLKPRLAIIRDRNAKVVEAAKTMSDAEISARMGLSRSTVSMVRRKSGMTIERARQDDIKQAVAAVAGGTSVRRAAQIHKMTSTTLSKHCGAAGVSSTHGRWGALDHRTTIVPDMLARGDNWKKILSTLSRLEKRKVKIQALRSWLTVNIPNLNEVVGDRSRALRGPKDAQSKAAVDPMGETPNRADHKA